MRQHLTALLCVDYPSNSAANVLPSHGLLKLPFVSHIIARARLSNPQKVSSLLPALIYQWADLLALDPDILEKSLAVQHLQLSRLDGVKICTASMEAVLHLQPKHAHEFARHLALGVLDVVDSADMALGSLCSYVYKAQAHWKPKLELVR